MTDIVKFDLGGGESVLVEIAEVGGYRQTSRRPDGIIEAGKSITEALAGVRPVAAALIDNLRQLAPRETTIEFGIKLSAEAGVLIAKTGVEGHFTVKLTFGGNT